MCGLLASFGSLVLSYVTTASWGAASPSLGGQAHNIPFVLASFDSLVLSSFDPLVLSYVTTASGGAASPSLGGQRTPKGKGKYKARIRGWTNHQKHNCLFENKCGLKRFPRSSWRFLEVTGGL